MGITVPVADWIKRIADDERRRDAACLKQTEIAARKVDLVGRQGRRLVDELRAAVTRDVAAFRDEFPGDRARDVTVADELAGGGFSVRKPAPAAVSLTVTPDMDRAALLCAYSYTPSDGLPPREDRLHVLFIDDGGETLRMKHDGTGKSFATADALSEFLLVPVLTGRSR